MSKKGSEPMQPNTTGVFDDVAPAERRRQTALSLFRDGRSPEDVARLAGMKLPEARRAYAEFQNEEERKRRAAARKAGL